jgi:hypothetical protein
LCERLHGGAQQRTRRDSAQNDAASYRAP